MNHYIYQPLIYDNQIRILTLMPGYDRDAIEGTLDFKRLRSRVASKTRRHKVWTNNEASRAYDALSYAWGDPEQVEEILVDGKKLGTARNLHTALLRLRHPKERRRLWIDAICINQSDNHERSHQVSMMQKIYSAAASVVVWLGDPTSDVAPTLDMILEYNNDKRRRTILSYKHDALSGLRKLFQETWWRRIWIVQEVVAARALVIVLGRTTFPWFCLRRVCSAIIRLEFSRGALAPLLRSCGFQKFRDLDSFRAAGAMPVMHLLRSTRDYHATDPRDKLYALLGMTSDLSTQDLAPDYNRPVRKVFQDLVHFMAVRQGSLDLICLGQCLGPDQSQSWLPSWQAEAGIKPFGRKVRSYQAARDTQAVIDMSQFPRTLIAEGIIADAVAILGGSFTIAHECASTILRWYHLSTRAKTCSYGDFLEVIGAGVDSPRRGRFEPFLQHPGKARPKVIQKRYNAINRTAMGRRFFTTKNERIGLCPAEVQMNDKIVVLKGCQAPIIIRARQDHWVIVGEAYVVGMMSGEVLSGPESESYRPIMIPLK
ncbi:het-domain-containing protein [Fusarium flagelliforme]|uniref:Het-domain-containing protein n=1 Tax=Fusarium flagelliforme TaxID=2675880 RepID=A0A395MM87_9HYPO|nr:het-domain-containing protein [Fusarium flagelliforme]